MSRKPNKIAGRPFWLLRPCPSWCDGLHEDADLVGHRQHHSRWGKRIRLSTMDASRAEFGVPGGQVRYEPFVVHVRIEQGYREFEPRVSLGEAHHGGRFALTLAEAERLSKTLAKAVALARSD